MEEKLDLSQSLSNYEVEIIQEFIESKEGLDLKIIKGEYINSLSALIKVDQTGEQIKITANQFSKGTELEEDSRFIRIERSHRDKNAIGYKVDTAHSIIEFKELLNKHWEEICQEGRK